MLKSIFKKAATMNLESPGKLGLIIGYSSAIALSFTPAFQKAVSNAFSTVPDAVSLGCVSVILGSFAIEAAIGLSRRRMPQL